jgi:integrase
MKRAQEDGWLKGGNPCQVKGAQNARSGKALYTPTLEEVFALANEINPRFRVALLVSAYGALRFGELTALQRKHFVLREIDGIERFVIQIELAVTHVNKSFIVGSPKNQRGKGTVQLSSALTLLVKNHLENEVSIEPDSLVFPSSSGTYLRNDVLAKAMKQALKRLGWETKGITPHSLRRAGATAYSNLGANISEVQDFLRDASPAAALLYIKSTNRSSELTESLEIPSDLRKTPLE